MAMDFPLWTPAAELSPRDVRIVVVDTDSLRESPYLASYMDLLSTEEEARRQRFHFERDRHLYLVAHALLRTVLVATTGALNQSLRFVVNEYGCPSLAEPAVNTHVRFNLSHSHGMAACAVTIDRDIGVDVEDRTRKGAGLAIADAYFSTKEVAALRLVPPSDEQKVFFTFWTLKEAYIKARGMGLALPLDKFSFDLSRCQSPMIEIDPELRDSPSQWRFQAWDLSDRHALAVAVRCSPFDDVVLQVSRWDGLPLQ